MNQPKKNFCVRVHNDAQIDAVLAVIEQAGGKIGGLHNRDKKDTKSIYDSTMIGYAWPSCFSRWQGSCDGKDFETVEEFICWYLDTDPKAKERAEKQEEVDRLERELLVAKQELKALAK